MSTDDDIALPNGAVELGTYDCTWSLNGVEVPGAVELLGGKFPHGTARWTTSQKCSASSCARSFFV